MQCIPLNPLLLTIYGDHIRKKKKSGSVINYTRKSSAVNLKVGKCIVAILWQTRLYKLIFCFKYIPLEVGVILSYCCDSVVGTAPLQRCFSDQGRRSATKILTPRERVNFLSGKSTSFLFNMKSSYIKTFGGQVEARNRSRKNSFLEPNSRTTVCICIGGGHVKNRRS